MDSDESTIESEFGPLKFGIRSYQWKPGAGLQFTHNRVWLTFDEERDLDLSTEVLRESRQMAFEVQSRTSIKGRIYAYLGRPYDEWDDELAIELSHQNELGGIHQYYAEGGKKNSDEYGNRTEDDDIRRIRTNYWCAAQARVWLYIKWYDEDEPRPVCYADGNALCTRVQLQYQEEYEKLYNQILSDFSNLRGDLASRFERFAEFQKARQRAEDSLALELYKRLRDILPPYQQTLRDILRNPATQLKTTRVSYDLRTSQVDRHLGHQNTAVKMRRIRRTEPVGGRHLPTRFVNIEPTETASTAANKYVASSANRVYKLIKRVQRHLEQEQELANVELKRHDAAFERLDTAVQHFTRYRRKLPPPASFRTGRSPVQTPELSYDKRYQRLHQLTKRIDYLLSYVDASDLPFEVEAFNVLYERWCFVRVIEALKEIGFSFSGAQDRRTTMFYNNPIPNEVNCTMAHDQCSEKVLQVWYEREYPVLKKKDGYYDTDFPYGLEKRGAHRSTYGGWKNRPDIALEFHDCLEDKTIIRGRCPSIITLDPTLGSPQKRQDKYEYKEGIRSFVDEGEEGESMKIVAAAWGISPIQPDDPERMVTVPEKDYWKHGFIYLRPDDRSLERLPQTLDAILEAADIYEDKA